MNKPTRKPVKQPAGYLSFVLPDHVAVLKSRRSVAPWRDCEQVIENNGKVIVRLPKVQKTTLAACVEPSIRERIESWMQPQFKIDSHDTSNVSQAAREALAILASKARNGDGRALWDFANVVTEAAEGLSRMVASDPKAFEPLAEKMTRWPMMRSTHPLNCDSDTRLREIGLGRGLPFMLDQHSKWKPDNAAFLAHRLFVHINSLYEENPIIEFCDGEEIEVSKYLTPFNSKSAEKWWRLAWHELLKTYPKPELISELDRLVTSPTKRKSPGRRRQAIHDLLHRRFIAFAKL